MEKAITLAVLITVFLVIAVSDTVKKIKKKNNRILLTLFSVSDIINTI